MKTIEQAERSTSLTTAFDDKPKKAHGAENLDEFDDRVEEARSLLRKECLSWLRDPDVVAVDVGFKTEFKNGRTEPEFPAQLHRVNGTRISDAELTYLQSVADSNERIEEDLQNLVRLSQQKTSSGKAASTGNVRLADYLSREPSKLKSTKTVESYDPWIRVHVQRKVKPEDIRSQNRRDYSKELIKGTLSNYYVHVVEGPYRSMAKRAPTKIEKKLKDLEEGIDERYEALLVDVRRKLDSKGRSLSRKLTSTHSRLTEKDRELETRDKTLEDRVRALEKYVKAPKSAGEMEVDRTGYIDPLIGGVSIGNARGAGGTLGAIVWDRTDGTPCILSNCHVLAGGGTEEGDPCIQPARRDGGTTRDHTVAHMRRWFLGDYVDAALAELNGKRPYVAAASPYRRIAGETPKEGIVLGLRVESCGRTSGQSFGVVDGVGMSVAVDFGDTVRTLHDQIHVIADPEVTSNHTERTEEVTRRGDSGAIWIDSLHQATALQFAGDTENCAMGDFAIANPMHYVSEALDFSFEPLFVRREERETREAVSAQAFASLPPDTRDVAKVLQEVLQEILQRFSADDVGSALYRIREAVIGSQPDPVKRPASGGFQ